MHPSLTNTMNECSKRRHLVLLSGGIDSALCLHWATEQAARYGGSVNALTVNYGQPIQERTAATRLAAHYRVGYHLTAKMEPPWPAVFDGESDGNISGAYLPQRNTIILSMALAMAEQRGSRVIWFGVNADDAKAFPDTTPGYVKAFQRFANSAWPGPLRAPLIDTPLSTFTKAEVVAAATKGGVPLDLCWSCYTPTDDGDQCGECESCVLARPCKCPPGRCSGCTP